MTEVKFSYGDLNDSRSSSTACIEDSLSAIDDLLKETNLQLAAIREPHYRELNSPSPPGEMSASISSSQSNNSLANNQIYHDFSPNGSFNGTSRPVHRSNSCDDINMPSPEPSFSSLGSEEVRKSLEELDAVIQAFDEEYRDVKSYFNMSGQNTIIQKTSPNILCDRLTPTRDMHNQGAISPYDEEFPLPPPPPESVHVESMTLSLATATESYSDNLESASTIIEQDNSEMVSTPVLDNRIYDLPTTEDTPRNSHREKTPEQTVQSQLSLNEKKSRVPPPSIPKRSPSTCLTQNSAPTLPPQHVLEAYGEESCSDMPSPQEVVLRDDCEVHDDSIDTSSRSVTDIIKRFSNSKNNSAAGEESKATNSESENNKSTPPSGVPLVKQLANQFSIATSLTNQQTFSTSSKQVPAGATPILPISSTKAEAPRVTSVGPTSATNNYVAPVVPPSIRGVNVMPPVQGPAKPKVNNDHSVESNNHNNSSYTGNSTQQGFDGNVYYCPPNSATPPQPQYNNGHHHVGSPVQSSPQTTGSPIVHGAIPIPVPKIPKKAIQQSCSTPPPIPKGTISQMPPPMNPVNTCYSESNSPSMSRHANPPPPAIVPTIPRRGSSHAQSGSPARHPPPPPPQHPPPRNLPPPPPPPQNHMLNISSLPPPPPPPPMQAFCQQPLPPAPNLPATQLPLPPPPSQYSVPHQQHYQYQPQATSSPIPQRVPVPVPPPVMPGSAMKHLHRGNDAEMHSPLMKHKMRRNDLLPQRSHSIDTPPDMQAAIVAQLKGGIKLRRASDVKSIEELPDDQSSISKLSHLPEKSAVGQSPAQSNSVNTKNNNNINLPNQKNMSQKITTPFGVFDVADIPGYQIAPIGCPEWKKQLIDRKNKEVLDAFLKIKEEEEKERQKWENVPQWKRTLLEKKELEKKKDEPVKEEEDKEHIGDSEGVPEWKKHWIVKKKIAADDVTNES